MSYIEQSLGANETVHYVARFPTVRYVAAWIALGLGIGAALFAVMYEHTLVGAFLALAGLFAFAWILYRPWTTEIAVTNSRLIYKRGFFQRRANDLQLRAIEEVRLRQDLLGRMLNYGSIEFYGTGVADLSLPAINNPVEFQKAMQEAIAATSDDSGLPGHMTMPSSKVPDPAAPIV